MSSSSSSMVIGSVGWSTWCDLVNLVTAWVESSCRTKEQYPFWWDVGERKEEGFVIVVHGEAAAVAAVAMMSGLLEFSMVHDFWSAVVEDRMVSRM